MKRVDVGIGEYYISQSEEEIKTYALGSCVALVVWDATKKTGGLIHIALPDSTINLQKAQDKPGYFVDSGLPVFFSVLKDLGANRKTSWVKLIGGASILDENKTFDIGRRNILGVKKYLWKIGLILNGEDTGGTISRTVSLSVPTGDMQISNGSTRWTV